MNLDLAFKMLLEAGEDDDVQTEDPTEPKNNTDDESGEKSDTDNGMGDEDPNSPDDNASENNDNTDDSIADTDDAANSEDDAGDDVSDSSDTDNDGDVDSDDAENAEDSSNGKLKQLQLSRTYVKLYDVLVHVIDKFKSVRKLSQEESDIIDDTVNKLEKIKTALFDYIDTSFSSSSYEQNLYKYYFFQNSIKLSEEIIQKIKKLREETVNK